jgi:hypothetical protein
MKPYCQRCREDLAEGEKGIMVYDKYYYDDYILVHDDCAYSSEIVEEY